MRTDVDRICVVLTCFSCVLHGRLVGGLNVEALQSQLLIFCRHFGVLVHYVDWRLVPLSAFRVGQSPALFWSRDT